MKWTLLFSLSKCRTYRNKPAVPVSQSCQVPRRGVKAPALHFCKADGGIDGNTWAQEVKKGEKKKVKNKNKKIHGVVWGIPWRSQWAKR